MPSTTPPNPDDPRHGGPTAPSSSPHDLTRDLAISHLVERLADGEIRPDERPWVEESVASLPDGPAHVAEQQALRAACSRVMSVVPVDPGVQDRVMHAVHLRLRGESDALRQLSLTSTPKAPTPDRISGRLSFWRLTAAATLVLAGFIGARVTDRTLQERDFTGTADAASTLGGSSGLPLSNDYYVGAMTEAERFLGHPITLPSSSDVRPLRYLRGEADAQPRTVTFVYLVRVPDPSGVGETISVPAPLVIQANQDTDFDPAVVVEREHGDIHWRIRQIGPLIYNIQSESEHAVDLIADLLGWPAPLEAR